MSLMCPPGGAHGPSQYKNHVLKSKNFTVIYIVIACYRSHIQIDIIFITIVSDILARTTINQKL